MSDVIGNLLTATANLASAGIQAWGVSQEARRNAQMQHALSVSRQGFDAIYQEIQRTPDYSTYEDMFEEGSRRLREQEMALLKDDPFLQQQFAASFTQLQDSVRSTVQTYAFQRERTAIVTEGAGQVADTFLHSPTFEDAEREREQIISGLYNTGMIDEAGREQFRSEWRRLGGLQLETRLEAAVENMDRARVKQLLDGAFATEIIRDPAVAADRAKEALHAIGINEARQMALEMGIEEGINWIMDPEPKGLPAEVTSDDRRAIWAELVELRNWQREEDRWQRAERERVALEEGVPAAPGREAIPSINSLEAEMQAGRTKWSEGLAFLDTDYAREALRTSTWQQLHDRWTHELEETLLEEKPPELQSPLVRSQTMERIYQMYKKNVPPGEIELAINEAVMSGYLNFTEGQRMREFEREGRVGVHGSEGQLIDAAIAAADFDTGTSWMVREMITSELEVMRHELKDGEPISTLQLQAKVDQIIKNFRPDGVSLKERGQVRNILGRIFDGDLRGLTEDELAMSFQERQLTLGTIDTDVVGQIAQWSSMNGSTELIRAAVLNGLPWVVPGQTYEDLDEIEQRIVDNTVRSIELARDHYHEYLDRFGRPTDAYVKDTGEMAFFDNETGTWYQKNIIDKDAVWVAWNGSTWIPGEPKELPDAPAPGDLTPIPTTDAGGVLDLSGAGAAPEPVVARTTEDVDRAAAASIQIQRGDLEGFELQAYNALVELGDTWAPLLLDADATTETMAALAAKIGRIRTAIARGDGINATDLQWVNEMLERIGKPGLVK